MGDTGKAGLAELVEQLAVRLVMGDCAEAVALEMLAGIQGQAATEGRPDVARLAAEVGASLSQGAQPAGAEELERTIGQGVARLQAALASEAAPQAAESSGTVLTGLAEDPELVADFILESREHLSSIETQLLTLERDPANAEAINSIFRGFHTIKGLAGFLELGEIQSVAHETETLLDQARNGRLRITPSVIDVILASADFLNRWLVLVEAMQRGGAPGPAPDSSKLREQIRAAADQKQEAPAAPPERAPEEEAAEPADSPAATARSAEARLVKVDTGKLDYLVDMAGEMVIAQSLVRHDPDLAALNKPRLTRNLGQLGRITSELQKTAMSMRMVPIGQLFQKMARLVRDLARKSSKQTELELVGEDTELDRNIVEELADPLMHMVRNAVDHGVEPPAVREQAGKPPAAHLRLKASHQGGQIVIEVSDDGRGLDAEKILAKARQRGLLEEGAHPSEQEIFNLIFHPGFSTAEQVTDVSGRGVGMDVVRKHIQKLRGRIDIESQRGQGTTFLLKLPLTLAIIEGLVVGVGQERYILPIFVVREIFRPSAESLFTLEGRDEMVMVRGRLLPVVRLWQRFGVRPRSENGEEALLVVVEAAGKVFCLMVEDLIGKQEVVIKSLGETFKRVRGIAGGAILGDGRVGLILDVDGLYGVSSDAG